MYPRAITIKRISASAYVHSQPALIYNMHLIPGSTASSMRILSASAATTTQLEIRRASTTPSNSAEEAHQYRTIPVRIGRKCYAVLAGNKAVGYVEWEKA